MKTIKNNEGFTLAELVVVIAILGILSSMIVLNMQPILSDSLITRIKSDLLLLQSAGNMYVEDEKDGHSEEYIEQEVLVGPYLSQWVESPVAGYEYKLRVIETEHRVRVRVTLEQNGVLWQDERIGFIADSRKIKW